MSIRGRIFVAHRCQWIIDSGNGTRDKFQGRLVNFFGAVKCVDHIVGVTEMIHISAVRHAGGQGKRM
jgi:hypothetical protein